MCLTIFCTSPQGNPSIKLIFGFNREEQSQRQTLRFDKFVQDENIYGGRDIKSGGTWLGINISTGLLVFLTNYDLPNNEIRYGKSRGQLVYKFLSSSFIPSQRRTQADDIIKSQLCQITKSGKQYSPFNLTIYNIITGNMFYMCSQWSQKCIKQIQNNKSYGICNSDIDTIWPKTNYGIQLFQKIKDQIKHFDLESYFMAMKQIFTNKYRFSQVDNDESSIFVQPYYNTIQKAERKTKSTLLMIVIEKQGKKYLTIKEITYKNGSGQQQVVEFIFTIG